MSSQECSRVTDDRAAIRRAGCAEAVNPADKIAIRWKAAMSAPNFASTNHNATQAPNAPNHSYGELVARGFTDGEAGTLAAYLEGLDVAHHTWTLREVNGLLFIRQLNRANRFGQSDGDRNRRSQA
jgi:hypothetical protein